VGPPIYRDFNKTYSPGQSETFKTQHQAVVAEMIEQQAPLNEKCGVLFPVGVLSDWSVPSNPPDSMNTCPSGIRSTLSVRCFSHTSNRVKCLHLSDFKNPNNNVERKGSSCKGGRLKL
jgi:hypothetical protein